MRSIDCKLSIHVLSKLCYSFDVLFRSESIYDSPVISNVLMLISSVKCRLMTKPIT
jgi:hypothetical protein